MRQSNALGLINRLKYRSIHKIRLCLLLLFGISFQALQADPPNCRSINVSVSSDDSLRLYVFEVLSNSSTTYPVSVSIENEWGGIIWQAESLKINDIITLPACPFLDDRLKINVSNQEGDCWSYLTIKSQEEFVLESNLDTTVWCIDPLLQLDKGNLADIGWYHTRHAPYTLLPSIEIFCEEDKIFPGTPSDIEEVRDWYLEVYEECELRAIDWPQSFPCFLDQDTAEIIIREWEAFDKDGRRYSVFDTIVSIKLPELTADNLYVPTKDTVNCYIDTIYSSEYTIEYTYWKQLVGTHSDGTNLFYPKTLVDYSIASASSQEEMDLLEQQKIIIRSNQSELDVYDIANRPTTFGPYGELSYYIPISSGDQVLSYEGSYLTVDQSWFYDIGTNGIYVDLAIPNLDAKRKKIIKDKWQKSDCENGVKIIIPERPYESGNCQLLCIDDLVSHYSKCRLELSYTSKDITNYCPRLRRKDIIIKQFCYSTAAVENISSCIYEPDTTGVKKLEKDPHDGSVKVEISQWKIYLDRLGPLVESVRGQTIWSTTNQNCYANIVVPEIRAFDYCSGVSGVKATIEDLGFVQLTRGSDGFWYQSENERKFKLLCGGPYQVTYELMDSCYNTRRVKPIHVYVRDNQAPTVIMNKGARVSLGSKLIRANAATFDAGSIDNCDIRMVLGRRTDWKSSCGVSLCDEVIGSISTKEELGRYIRDYGYASVLADNEIETFYKDAYQWIKEDAEWCADIENFIVRGWETDIVDYWVKNCIKNDHYSNEFPESPSFYASIGGGWAEEIPFCCGDVCQPVSIELLVIDKSCNFSKGWMTIEVEDKTAFSKTAVFDHLYLSCDSYQKYYRQSITDAIASGNNSEQAPELFAEIDEKLGRLIKAWEDVNQNIVDEHGQEIEESFDYKNSYCDYEITQVRKKVIDHDGKVEWKWVQDTTLVLKDTTESAEQGVVLIQCDVKCVQDVWENLNECGVGTVTRRWTVSSKCSDHTSPIQYEQVIHVDNACEMNIHMFDLPSDTVLCTALKYDASSNVAVEVGTMDYALPDTECRNLDVGYRDLVSSILGQPNMYKVQRNWTINDWCTSESVNYTQVIALHDTCSDSNTKFGISGHVLLHYNQAPIPDAKVNMERKDGSIALLTSNSQGEFSTTVSRNENIDINVQLDDKLLDGVDIGDIIGLQSHILYRNRIENEYQLMAADVNNDHRINSKDIITIRNVILRRNDQFTNNTSWRFVEPSSMNESILIENINRDYDVTFFGVKIGDVDNQGLNLRRSSNRLVGEIQDQMVNKGEQLSIPLKFETPVLGYQLAIKYDPRYVKFLGLSGEGISSNNWNLIETGEVLIVHSGEKAMEGFEIIIEATDEVKLSDVLAIGSSSHIVAKVIDAEYDQSTLVLNYLDDLSVGQFELHQNVPNPATDRTVISFNLPEEDRVELRLYDISGKLILERNWLAQAGFNEVQINLDDYSDFGVLYYQVVSSQYSDQKKMVILR